MPISHILKDLTTSQSFDAASVCRPFQMVMWIDHVQELQRSFEKFSKQVNNAQNESNPSVIPSSSLDGISRFNKPMPSSSPYDQFPQLGGFNRSICTTAALRNMIDKGEHDLLDSDYDMDGPSLNTGCDDDGERRRSSCQPLWTGTTRCPPRKPSAANNEVFQVTKQYFVAMIFSGAAGNENTAWLVPKEMWVSNSLDRAWKIMATRMGRNTGRKNHDAAAKPPREEARLVG